jgi:hypothetical protein
MTQLVEVRSYRLHPGSRRHFERLFRDEALPQLKRSNVDVVAFGGSPDDAEAAFLIRAYADLTDRREREEAFYGSGEWRQGPREAILTCIETFTDTLLTLDERTVNGLRGLGIRYHETEAERSP